MSGNEENMKSMWPRCRCLLQKKYRRISFGHIYVRQRNCPLETNIRANSGRLEDARKTVVPIKTESDIAII